MASPTEITPFQLARLIGTPECPVLVDVRSDADFDQDPYVLPGAFRHRFDDMAGLAPRLTDARVIVYCHKGLKLSQGAAAVLHSAGFRAETLEGGQVACPWLIRRFVDPAAQFLFVAPAQVQAVAERFGATPFDIEGVFRSHRDDFCTFDTMIAEFGLNTDALARLALIIRAADTNRHDLAPEAAGLLAASLGLSRMYRDDLAQLDAGMALYDAFYRWARNATDEGHDWPAAVREG